MEFSSIIFCHEEHINCHIITIVKSSVSMAIIPGLIVDPVDPRSSGQSSVVVGMTGVVTGPPAVVSGGGVVVVVISETI